MFAKQLTVFIENRTGRLSEVLSVLRENNVNIISMSLADTTEYGLLRLIVDNAQIGKEKLNEQKVKKIKFPNLKKLGIMKKMVVKHTRKHILEYPNL